MIKAISTLQYVISSTAMLPTANSTNPIWLLGVQYACYEPLPQAVSLTLSRSGPFAPMRVFTFCSSTSSMMATTPYALVITTFKMPRCILSARSLRRFYVTRLITPPSTDPIRDSSFTILEREQAEAAAAGVPTPISSSPPSNVGG